MYMCVCVHVDVSTRKWDDMISPRLQREHRQCASCPGGRPPAFCGGFHKRGYPQNGWFIREKVLLDWMITRGSPILGTHQVVNIGFSGEWKGCLLENTRNSISLHGNSRCFCSLRQSSASASPAWKPFRAAI